MILPVSKHMKEVDERIYQWFLAKLDSPQRMEYSNGIAWLIAGDILAAHVNGKHYIVPNK